MKVDELVKSGAITEKVVAQIAHSDYEPVNYEWHRFMDRDVFKRHQEEATLIISHGGTGALVGALKLGKKVIAVPRLAKYGEHIDDHQIQVSSALEQEGYLRVVIEMDELESAIVKSYEDLDMKIYNRPSNVLSIIDKQIEMWFG